MSKKILITGATDGIGLETAKKLAVAGHQLLLHGRSDAKLKAAAEAIGRIAPGVALETYRADLSVLQEVLALADNITAKHTSVDVLINNAGVFKTSKPTTPEGYDVRFIVNVAAPYLLTEKLLPLMGGDSRIVNLSSAAQAPVHIDAVLGQVSLTDSEAYAQSKLALTMWSLELAAELAPSGPSVVAVNPASFLGSKMVKEAYGSDGHDLSIGADILERAAVSEEFSGITGRYFDNDRRQFADPHPDALNSSKNKKLVETIKQLITTLTRA